MGALNVGVLLDVEIDRLVPVVQVIVDDWYVNDLNALTFAKGHVAGDRFIIDTVPGVPSAETKPIVNDPAVPPVRTISICAIGWLSSTAYVLELNEIVPGKRAPL